MKALITLAGKLLQVYSESSVTRDKRNGGTRNVYVCRSVVLQDQSSDIIVATTYHNTQQELDAHYAALRPVADKTGKVKIGVSKMEADYGVTRITGQVDAA